MIAGTVTADLEAVVRLTVVGGDERREHIRAVIDTGFSGSLTLPSPLVAALDLVWVCRQPGTLADGRTELFDVYQAVAIWDGVARTIEVEASNSDPLLGMALPAGHDLRARVAPGGRVEIEAIP